MEVARDTQLDGVDAAVKELQQQAPSRKGLRRIQAIEGSLTDGLNGIVDLLTGGEEKDGGDVEVYLI
jgi:hypothetical protein